MHPFNFGLIAVLSCIAMIGATPVGNSAPAEAIVRRQDGLSAILKYVLCQLQLQHVDVLTWSKIFLQSTPR